MASFARWPDVHCLCYVLNKFPAQCLRGLHEEYIYSVSALLLANSEQVFPISASRYNMLARTSLIRLGTSPTTAAPLRAATPTTVTVNSKASFHSSPQRQELSAEHQKMVKSTVPVLAEHGVAITGHFYKRMLDNHPELQNIFNSAHQSTGTQPATLGHAVWAYAANIDDLRALTSAVSRIGHKHASLGITPDQYPIVGENLLAPSRRSWEVQSTNRF